MALRLQLVSAQAADLGEAATLVLGVHGGRLGRAFDNDWPLPDEHRYLSAYHAAFTHLAGEWRVMDTSSNGTWINREPQPIGRGNSRKLHHGDRLRFGNYVALVSLVADNNFSLDADLVGADTDHLINALPQATDDDLGALLDLQTLLEAALPPARDAGRTPRATVSTTLNPGRAMRREDSSGFRLPPANAAPPPTREQQALQAAALLQGTAAVAPAGPTVPTTALTALGRGLGLDLSSIPAERQTAVLAAAGQLLREYTLGVMEQLREERVRSERLDLSPGSAARNPNPLEALESTDEALTRLLVTPGQRFMAPVDAVRDAFKDLSAATTAHEQALCAGINHLLEQLAPTALSARFDRILGPQGHAGNPAQYWALYPDLHRAVTQRRVDGLPYAFTEAYVAARPAATAAVETTLPTPTDHLATVEWRRA